MVDMVKKKSCFKQICATSRNHATLTKSEKIFSIATCLRLFIVFALED